MIIESIINVVFGVLINIFDFLSIPPTPQFLLNLESNILSLFSYVMPLINFLFSHSMLATLISVSKISLYLLTKNRNNTKNKAKFVNA